MKRILFSMILCAVFILSVSGLAFGNGPEPPTDLGGLFLVDIDAERVVLQFWGSEQAWQFYPDTTEGWWDGLAPHPFDFKIWYPNLFDSDEMTLEEQLAWIDGLEFAGIDDWRIGTFWDTIPLKASIFGGLPSFSGPNRVNGYNSTVYFPLTCARGTWGRTGNEPFGKVRSCDGAIIEVGPDHGFHWENYPEGTRRRHALLAR